MTERQRVVFLAGSSERGIRAAFPFARRAAEFNAARLEVWLADSSAHDLGISVDTPEWLEELGDVEHVEVDAVAVRDVPEAIEQFASREDPVVAIAVGSRVEAGTPYFRNLVGAPPCRLLVLINPPADFHPRRVLLAANRFSNLSDADLTLGYKLAECGPGTHVTVMELVAHGMADDEVGAAEERLLERATKFHGDYSFEVAVKTSRSYESGLLDALEHGDFDVVIGDTPRSGLIARFSERVLPQRLVDRETPLLLYTAPTGKVARFALQLWNVIYRAVPSTDEHARYGIYTDVRRRSRTDPDYYMMLSLSVIIASLGLLLDSTAVVIGAMIIAPLMQPIIGIGLGISMGSVRLLSIGLRSVTKGVLVGLAFAFAAGYVVPGATITSELDARGQPNLLDLGIALASGAAGAYATCRPGVANTVAGVAIAVALVPPLATAGIGLAIGEYPLAMGAGLLLATNFVAISASSALMFLWVGFKPEPSRFGSQKPFVQGVLVLGGLVAAVALTLIAWNRAGELAFERRLDMLVEEAVTGIDPDSAIEDVSTPNRNGSVLFVDVTVETLDPSELLEQRLTIQSDLSRELDRPVDLRIRTVEPEEDEEG